MALNFSIGSYSFHRLLAAGKQDMFQYIQDCKTLGASQLEPWNAHLAAVKDEDTVLKAGSDPENAGLSAQTDDYITRVKAAADAAGLPFGCLAVDGAHIYEPTEEKRAANRASAHRWLDVAQKLGASSVRIDCGGPAEMPDDVFQMIVEGYHDLIARGREKGVQIVIENHWGPSPIPENLIRILDAAPGLGLLFDTNNWAEGMEERAWEMCARYATATHIKTFNFDEAGNEPSVDLHKAMRLLVEAGYSGVWGIESCPDDGDEYGGVRKTAALIERILNQLGVR
jgi:sugar phosphate isomerase/epimerase